MTIKKLLPITPGYAGLSTEAKGVVATLARYGGNRGLLIGAGRLASIISNAGDAADFLQQRTGKRPAIYVWDYCDPLMYPGNTAQVTADTAAAIALMKAHWEAGGICGFHISWRNFRTASTNYSGDWFDRRRDRPQDVSDLLLGAATTAAKTAYWAFIDSLAASANTWTDSKGRKIPQVFRLFAECNGWYDFVAGEGYNPGTQTDRYITSIVKQASGKYRITFASRPAGAGSPSIPLDGSVIQVTGSSDAANWNSRYDNATVVSGTDNVGDVLVVDCYKGEAQPAGSAPADGTLRAYPVNGFWWAGRDRAADLMTLTQQTMDYLRNTKGCTHLVHATAIFPFNGVSSPWSSQETQTNASAQTFAYDNWHPGAAYVDVGGIDYYPSTSSTETFNNPTLKASCERLMGIGGMKPWMIHELGFGSGNGMNGAGHTVPGFWTREVQYLMDQYPRCCGFSFWSKYMFPDTYHPAYASFVEMVNTQAITLDKLKRLV